MRTVDTDVGAAIATSNETHDRILENYICVYVDVACIPQDSAS